MSRISYQTLSCCQFPEREDDFTSHTSRVQHPLTGISWLAARFDSAFPALAADTHDWSFPGLAALFTAAVHACVYIWRLQREPILYVSVSDSFYRPGFAKLGFSSVAKVDSDCMVASFLDTSGILNSNLEQAEI